jgi:hypothetical protein
MDALVFLFILGIVVFLNWPQKPKPRPDVWVELGKAIGAAVREACASPGDGKKKVADADKSESSNDFGLFLLVFILFGILVSCLT